MTLRFRGSTDRIIVTLVTITNTSRIVSPGAADECCSGMTGVTIQSGIYMHGINLGILAKRGNTIMAGFAVINDTGMIESGSDEAASGMTDSAILIRW